MHAFHGFFVNMHSWVTVFWVLAPLKIATSSWDAAAGVAQQSALCGDGRYCDYSFGMTSIGEGTISEPSMGTDIEGTSRRLTVTVDAFAGKPVAGSSSFGGGKLDAVFGYPTSLAVDHFQHHVYISDPFHQKVFEVSASGGLSRLLSGPTLNVTIGDVHIHLLWAHWRHHALPRSPLHSRP